jgi:hypothetical protein
MIADYNQVEIDLRNIFSLPMPKSKDLIGQEVYKNIYQIMSEISSLGLLQNEISLLGKKTNTLADLTKLNLLKKDFKLCLLKITDYWIIISKIIELEEILNGAVEEEESNLGKGKADEIYKVALFDEINTDVLETDNIGFYIFLLLDAFSDFCRGAKSLGLAVLSDTNPQLVPELFNEFPENTTEEITEDDEAEFFWGSVKDFCFLLLLVKFIAYKFGIDYMASLEEYLSKKYS